MTARRPYASAKLMRSSLRVNRVGLAVGWPLPIYPDKRTFSESAGTSQRCQKQPSLLGTIRIGFCPFAWIKNVHRLAWKIILKKRSRRVGRKETNLAKENITRILK